MPADEAPNVFRPGGVSYLRIPCDDAQRSAAFYRAVFGWRIDVDRDVPSFEDGSGHVIGHFVTDLRAADAGVRPYVFVEDVDDALERATTNGGTVTIAPYREGDLSVAAFRDLSGNVIGVWQTGAATSLR